MQDDEPEAYKLGWIPFLELEIHLDSKPLIPRPETEWWVEQLIYRISQLAGSFAEPKDGALRAARPSLTPSFGSAHPLGRELRILDLCAGSGAIGCALMQAFPTAHVSFGEIDPAHEATIRKNIAVNNLDAARADVRLGDLFAPFAGEQFDLIATNPPYIPEARELPPSVTDYEPALALRAGEDGLALIRRIALELRKHLAPGGQAWIECDISNIEEAQQACQAAGFSAEIRPDQYGRPRVLVIS